MRFAIIRFPNAIKRHRPIAMREKHCRPSFFATVLRSTSIPSSSSMSSQYILESAQSSPHRKDSNASSKDDEKGFSVSEGPDLDQT